MNQVDYQQKMYVKHKIAPSPNTLKAYGFSHARLMDVENSLIHLYLNPQ